MKEIYRNLIIIYTFKNNKLLRNLMITETRTLSLIEKDIQFHMMLQKEYF